MDDRQLLQHELERLRAENFDLREARPPVEALKMAMISERKHQELVTHMPNGVAIFTAVDGGIDFICRSVNPAGERINNRPAADLVGQRFTRHYPELGSAELLSVMQRVWQTGSPDHCASVRHRDGRIVKWHEHYVYRLPEKEIVVITDNQTAEKQLCETLRLHGERLRVLLDALADGVLAATLDTRRFVYANPAVGALFGYAPEEMLQLSITDIHPPEALPQVIAEFEAQARREKKVAFRCPCRRKDGSIFCADISTAPFTFDGLPCNIGIFRESPAA